MKINEKQLRNLIKESIEKLLSEAVTNKVDNFDMISNMLNLSTLLVTASERSFSILSLIKFLNCFSLIFIF